MTRHLLAAPYLSRVLENIRGNQLVSATELASNGLLSTAELGNLCESCRVKSVKFCGMSEIRNYPS